MRRAWTFGQKIAGGLAIMIALSVLMATIATRSLATIVASKDHIINVNAENLITAERLHQIGERQSSSLRGYFLTRDDHFLAEMDSARASFTATVAQLGRAASTDDDRQALALIDSSQGRYMVALQRLVEVRKTDVAIPAISAAFDRDVLPRHQGLDQAVTAFVTLQQHVLDTDKQTANQVAASARTMVLGVSGLVLLVAIVVAIWLTGSLTRQVGSAVQHVQSSSAELQTAANQQATGAREQATAMSEITTTISELLATSQQIADSAQRVAQIAEDTAAAARSGEGTMTEATGAIGNVKHQVDLIVAHMLDLGKKSQEIGAILQIITELAEQTNILAINATIEAAGAGNAGRRFGVVADEIRKLADRVAGSTKDIRTLIDDVRAAVNATVMTTEGGSKAADAGARQFEHMAAALTQIVSLVGTTREAAREIELSTKQQSTAVGQVNIAVASVAQATKETEASSTQTFQTASQLTELSRGLLRLVQAQATA